MLQARASIALPLPPERAFAHFTEEFGAWWPAEYTWSQGALEEIGVTGETDVPLLH